MGNSDGVRFQCSCRSDAGQDSLLHGPPGRAAPIAPLHKLNPVIANQFVQLSSVPLARLRHFVVGLLTRTKVRGGVSHDLLRQYAAKQGNWYFLTKVKYHLMSPFGSHSRLPRLLSDLPNENVFDSIITTGNRRNWYIDLGHNDALTRGWMRLPATICIATRSPY